MATTGKVLEGVAVEVLQTSTKLKPITETVQHLTSFEALKSWHMTDLMSAVGANLIQRLSFPPFLTVYPSGSMPAENNQSFLSNLFSPISAKLRFEDRWIKA